MSVAAALAIATHARANIVETGLPSEAKAARAPTSPPKAAPVKGPKKKAV